MADLDKKAQQTAREACGLGASDLSGLAVPTSFFFNLPANPTLMRELEVFRSDWESRNLPCDPNPLYSTQMPHELQRNMPIEDYLSRAPNFVRAFFETRWRLTADDGRLDDVPDGVIALFATRARLRHGR